MQSIMDEDIVLERYEYDRVVKENGEEVNNISCYQKTNKQTNKESTLLQVLKFTQ